MEADNFSLHIDINNLFCLVNFSSIVFSFEKYANCFLGL